MRPFHLSLPVADLAAAADSCAAVLGGERLRAGSDWIDLGFRGHQLSGEQHTSFLTDPWGNAIECKAFPDGVWT